MKRVSALIKFNPNGAWFKQIPKDVQEIILGIPEPVETNLIVFPNARLLRMEVLGNGYHFGNGTYDYGYENDFIVIMEVPYEES